MARTHDASPSRQPTSRFHQDDGVVLGKGGEPIQTTPVRGITTLNPHGVPANEAPALIHMDDGELAPPPVPPATEFVWVCDKTTWQRAMDGWQAMHLLEVILGPLSVTLTDEQARKLPADTRWHWRRRAVPVAPEHDPDDPV